MSASVSVESSLGSAIPTLFFACLVFPCGRSADECKPSYFRSPDQVDVQWPRVDGRRGGWMRCLASVNPALSSRLLRHAQTGLWRAAKIPGFLIFSTKKPYGYIQSVFFKYSPDSNL